MEEENGHNIKSNLFTDDIKTFKASLLTKNYLSCTRMMKTYM